MLTAGGDPPEGNLAKHRGTQPAELECGESLIGIVCVRHLSQGHEIIHTCSDFPGPNQPVRAFGGKTKTMNFKLRNPRDFWAGLIFFAVGAAFAIIAIGDPFGIFPGYPIGSASRMGPGYFPFVLATIMAVLGLIIAFLSLTTDGQPVEKFAVRPLIFILGAVVIFGLLVKALGMALAIIVLVMVSAYGGHEFKFKEVLITAIILAVSSVLVFVYGLKLPFPIWPEFVG
jgi:hypothetical protein